MVTKLVTYMTAFYTCSASHAITVSVVAMGRQADGTNTVSVILNSWHEFPKASDATAPQPWTSKKSNMTDIC